MTPQYLEKKLNELGSTMAPQHSLVTRVMQRVEEASVPARPGFLRRIQASPVTRRVAAVLVVSATVVAAVNSFRGPHETGPIVVLQPSPVPDTGVIGVMDIRRVNFESPGALDAILRDRPTTASRDPEIHVGDVARTDLNLY